MTLEKCSKLFVVSHASLQNPIPISPLLASIEANSGQRDNTRASSKVPSIPSPVVRPVVRKNHTKIDEILEFEGAPVTGTPRAEPASTYLHGLATGQGPQTLKQAVRTFVVILK